MFNPDLITTAETTAFNAYSTEEVSSIINSTTGTTVANRDVSDKQLDDLMEFVFGDTMPQEDSYDY